MTLADVIGKSLKWKPFNGTWLNGEQSSKSNPHCFLQILNPLIYTFSPTDFELVYRDPTGGLSILNLDNYTTRVLMTNSTFVSLNLFHIIKFLLLNNLLRFPETIKCRVFHGFPRPKVCSTYI